MTRANTWEDPERWFWPRMDKSDPDGCWLWQGTEHHSGYGAVKVQGRQWGPHQVAYRLIYGEPEHDVLHRCGTRLCCNPTHLYDGTDKQNAADRDEHGRTAHHEGALNGNAKLTREQVDDIRTSGEPAVDAAARYGISKFHVWRLRRGERWKDTP